MWFIVSCVFLPFACLRRQHLNIEEPFMELDRIKGRHQLVGLICTGRAALLSLGFVTVVFFSKGVVAQEIRLPKDVDFGASGLVQFKYACAQDSCTARCFMTGNMVLEVKEAK